MFHFNWVHIGLVARFKLLKSAPSYCLQLNIELCRVFDWRAFSPIFIEFWCNFVCQQMLIRIHRSLRLTEIVSSSNSWFVAAMNLTLANFGIIYLAHKSTKHIVIQRNRSNVCNSNVYKCTNESWQPKMFLSISTSEKIEESHILCFSEWARTHNAYAFMNALYICVIGHFRAHSFHMHNFSHSN